MQRQDALDILQRMSEDDIVRTCVSLRYGAALTIDTLIRFEEDYMIVRGREAGTNDDNRAFFVPYEDILFIKLDRVVMPNEIKRMYGEKVVDVEMTMHDPDATVLTKKADDTKTPGSAINTPPPQQMDPAGIAKQNLLARIRAARTSVGAS